MGATTPRSYRVCCRFGECVPYPDRTHAFTLAGIELADDRIRELQAGLHQPVSIALSTVQALELRYGLAADRPLAQALAGLCLLGFGASIPGLSGLLDGALSARMTDPPRGVLVLCLALAGAAFNAIFGAWTLGRALLPRHHVRVRTAEGVRRLAFQRRLSKDEATRVEEALIAALRALRERG